MSGNHEKTLLVVKKKPLNRTGVSITYVVLYLIILLSIVTSYWKLLIGALIFYVLLNYRLREFGIITSNGIRPNQTSLIPWESIYDIKHELQGTKNRMVFKLSPDAEENLIKNFNYNVAHQFPEIIVIPGIRFDSSEYRAIMHAWKKNAQPYVTLKEKIEQLAKQYNLEMQGSVMNCSLTGKIDGYKIFSLCNLEQQTPVFSTSVFIPAKKLAYLNIGLETSVSKLKQSIGISDIELDLTDIDDRYQFQSSHPAQLKQLLTDGSFFLPFSQLERLATLSFTFGKPIKKNLLSLPLSKPVDSEDVLDTSMLKTKNTEQETPSDAMYNTLEFKGEFQSEITKNSTMAFEVIKLSLELSLILAKGINEF